MVRVCALCGSSHTRNPDLTFCSLPARPKLSAWRCQLIELISPIDKITEHTTICSRHFEDECFTIGPGGSKRLAEWSLPTKHMSMAERNELRPARSVSLPREELPYHRVACNAIGTSNAQICQAIGCEKRNRKTDSNDEHQENCAALYRFPLYRPDLVNKWLYNLNRKDFKPSSYMGVCADHFEPECFRVDQRMMSNVMRLKEMAIPTLFDFSKASVQKPILRKSLTLYKCGYESIEDPVELIPDTEHEPDPGPPDDCFFSAEQLKVLDEVTEVLVTTRKKLIHHNILRPIYCNIELTLMVRKTIFGDKAYFNKLYGQNVNELSSTIMVEVVDDSADKTTGDSVGKADGSVAENVVYGRVVKSGNVVIGANESGNGNVVIGATESGNVVSGAYQSGSGNVVSNGVRTLSNADNKNVVLATNGVATLSNADIKNVDLSHDDRQTSNQPIDADNKMGNVSFTKAVDTTRIVSFTKADDSQKRNASFTMADGRKFEREKDGIYRFVSYVGEGEYSGTSGGISDIKPVGGVQNLVIQKSGIGSMNIIGGTPGVPGKSATVENQVNRINDKKTVSGTNDIKSVSGTKYIKSVSDTYASLQTLEQVQKVQRQSLRQQIQLSKEIVRPARNASKRAWKMYNQRMRDRRRQLMDGKNQHLGNAAVTSKMQQKRRINETTNDSTTSKKRKPQQKMIVTLPKRTKQKALGVSVSVLKERKRAQQMSQDLEIMNNMDMKPCVVDVKRERDMDLEAIQYTECDADTKPVQTDFSGIQITDVQSLSTTPAQPSTSNDIVNQPTTTELKKVRKKCKTCGAVFKSNKHLKKHKIIHNHVDSLLNCHAPVSEDKYEYTCEICFVSFKQESDFETHVQQMHENWRYTCVFCSRVFPLQCRLSQHSVICRMKRVEKSASCVQGKVESVAAKDGENNMDTKDGTNHRAGRDGENSMEANDGANSMDANYGTNPMDAKDGENHMDLISDMQSATDGENHKNVHASDPQSATEIDGENVNQAVVYVGQNFKVEVTQAESVKPNVAELSFEIFKICPDTVTSRPQNSDDNAKNSAKHLQSSEMGSQNSGIQSRNFEDESQNSEIVRQNSENEAQTSEKEPQNFENEPPNSQIEPPNFENEPQNHDIYDVKRGIVDTSSGDIVIGECIIENRGVMVGDENIGENVNNEVGENVDIV